jgi:hypothetical protein
LGLVAAPGAGAGAAGVGRPPTIDVTQGQIDGQAAVSFWAVRGFDGETPLAVEGCSAHLQREEPGADELAETVIDCGVWTVPPAGRYRYWIEAPGLVSPAMNVFRFKPAPFRGKGTAAVRPVVPAGRVAVAKGSPWAGRLRARELWLRLLAVDSHNQGGSPLPELTRTVTGDATLAGVPMPVGGVVAGIWDPRAGEYVALARPIEVAASGLTVVDPRPPEAASDLLAVIELARPATTFDEAAVELGAVASPDLGGPARPPDLTVASVYRVFAVWYGVPERRVSLAAESPGGFLPTTEIPLRAGRVESYRGALRHKPGLTVHLEVPGGFEPPPGSAIVVSRLPDRLEVGRRPVDPRRTEYRFGPLKPERLEVVLDMPPVRTVRPADLSDGDDGEVTFELQPIRVAGTVYRGKRPSPATVTFRRGMEDDRYAVSAEADEDGDYELVLFRPARYDIYVALEGREGPPFISLKEPIEGDTLLDLYIPDNALRVRVVDEATGEGVGGATVMLVGHSRSFRLDETDAEGVALLPPQPPGPLRLVAAAEGYEEGPGVETIVGPEDRSREIRLPVRKTGAVPAVRLLLPGGAPAAGAEAWAVAAPGPDAAALWRGTADARGVLKLPRSVDGALLLVRHPGAGGGARRIDLPEREGAEPVPWTLAPRAPTLAIQVERAEGEPAPWARLAVWVDGQPLTGTPLRWLLGADMADSRGSWLATNLPAAPVDLVAWEAGSPDPPMGPSTRAMAMTVPFPWQEPVRLTAVR